MPEAQKESAPQGAPGPSPARESRFGRVMKWVGAATAVLTLGFGVQRVTELVSDTRRERREVDRLLQVAAVERGAGHYGAAWEALEGAAKVDARERDVEAAREGVAMEWLREIRVTEGKETFTDVVRRVQPTLTRGAAEATGSRRADLLAHLGWADYLRSRENAADADPERLYRMAAEADSGNVYAQAMWGHWILYQHGRVEDARPHFARALASGRERAWARGIEVAALLNVRTPAADSELVRVAGEARRGGETPALELRRRVVDRECLAGAGVAWPVGPDARPPAPVVAPEEELATFRWLFDGLELDESQQVERDFCLAGLEEGAGHREAALARYRALRAKLPDGSTLRPRADAAARRLSRPAKPRPESAVSG